MTFVYYETFNAHMLGKHLQAYNNSIQARDQARALAAKKAKKCSVCHRTFSSKQKREQHEKRIHGLASSSTATVSMHSRIEPVGEVTVVTESVITGFSINTRSTAESPLGSATITTQCLSADTVVITVTQTATEGSVTPPLTVVSSYPHNPFAVAEGRTLNTPPPLLLESIVSEGRTLNTPPPLLLESIVSEGRTLNTPPPLLLESIVSEGRTLNTPPPLPLESSVSAGCVSGNFFAEDDDLLSDEVVSSYLHNPFEVAEGRTLNTPPPLPLESSVSAGCVSGNFFAEDDDLLSDEIASSYLHNSFEVAEGRTLNTPPPLPLESGVSGNSSAKDSDPDDINSLLSDSWLD